MGIEVNIKQYKNFNYMEYYVTGFHQLLKEGIISRLSFDDPRINLINATPRFLRHRVVNRVRHANLDEHDNLVGEIKQGGRKRKFVINIQDTLWDFGSPERFENCDLFFKCQYPKDFTAGQVRLNQDLIKPIPDYVTNSAEKVRPLILGRPLGRSSNFRDNSRILDNFRAQRNLPTQRRHPLLYFTGGSYYDRKSQAHPNLKRTKLALWIKDNLPNVKLVFKLTHDLPEGHPERPTMPDNVAAIEYHDPVSDETYRSWLFECYGTLNTCGKRGSIPFRAIDSYLAGIVFLSDELYADWYEPLERNVDYYPLGVLGYELDEKVNYEAVFERLRHFVGNAEEIYREHRETREKKFNTYYSPKAVALHILNEAGFEMTSRIS